ncbi:MAG: hypothetical protein E7058_01450 [Lentisphaerae bacterium]|nr:hypothetical protein [Lentisphaerota bacterium]
MQHFDFTVTREEKRPDGNRGKNLRLLLLFCVVAAVTALVIWLLLPQSSEEKDAGGKADTPVETAAKDPANDAGSASDADPGKKDDKPADSGTTADPGKPADSGTTADPGKKNDKPVASGTTAAGKNGSAKYDPAIRELIKQTGKFRQALTGGSWKSAKYAVVHNVVNGDNLSNLCFKYHNTRAFVQQFNGIANANNISLGQKIAFIRADDWRITISRTGGHLLVERRIGKEFIPFAAFDCLVSEKGTLRDDLVVSRRVQKPNFIDRHGGRLASGTAGNPYGEFLISIARASRPDSPYMPLSIHGRGDQQAVETSVKNGATSMKPEDILLLYYLVPEGSPVRIVK